MSEESDHNATPESANPQTPPPAQAPPPGGQPAPSSFPKEQTDKKLVSGILAILLGWLGVHKFYLGYTVEGVIMLVVGIGGFLLCGIPTTAVWVIGVVEGILYLTKTDDEFVKTYVVGRKGWF